MRLGRGFAVIVLAVLALSMTPVVASAQTTPDPTPTTDPSATPTPTPDPTTTPSPTDDPTPSDSPTSDPSPTGDPSPSPDPGQRQHPGGLLSVAAPGLGGRIGADARKGPRSRGGRDGAWAPNPKWGAYSTQRLVVAERRLERHGMPERKALDAAFAPFPVGGLAVWSDTWGAPRYAGGYHPHHGQDLLCAEGTPLLAVQPGVVEFGSDPLGGTTIELTLRDGSFWYYAHLDHYAKGLTDGEHVSTGQVIGACGQSGDATVPHLHFSYFTASGDARNPMHALLGWLHRRRASRRGAAVERSRRADAADGRARDAVGDASAARDHHHRRRVGAGDLRRGAGRRVRRDGVRGGRAVARAHRAARGEQAGAVLGDRPGRHLRPLGLSFA